MKPNIDLSDPRVKKVISLYHSHMKIALEASTHIEDAVLPIYWLLRSKTKPEQIGSGVAIEIKGHFFIFSASHVFDVIGKYGLLVGLGDGSKLVTLFGDRFSTPKGKSKTHLDDPIDASVFHIQSPAPKKLREIAISYSDLDLHQPDKDNSVFIGAGFRVNNSNTKGNQAFAKRMCLPSQELELKTYNVLKIDSDIHLALEYEKQNLSRKGQWQTSPKLKGMSGGALIKVSGVSLSLDKKTIKKPKHLLSGIIISSKVEKKGKPGALIGTRVEVHLQLISKFLPKLE